MFELFPDGPVYEYPQVVNITYSFVWAFILASLIAITHRLTFTGDHYPKNFFQSLVLGAIVTTLVMMAIGDSLARGLGVFGAMAIIRFRTRIDDPRDVLFLFAALSTGLAIGVFGFTISFVGTVLFCAVAGLLHYSPFRSHTYQQRLYFTLSDPGHLERVKELLKQHCRSFQQESATVNKENLVRYQFGIILRHPEHKNELLEAMRQLPEAKQIRLSLYEPVNP
ncbi:MAG: DUF4956 domain-containing protein [Cyclobacteriaceae bacterium]|nr:DUF4956 domain-containing protein [Cyclobacteriaceae bacterium]